MNFADTNWVEAMFFEVEEPGKESRGKTVSRYLRHHGGQLGLSHLVYLEVRNIFSRLAGQSEPEEWRLFQQSLGGKFYLDPMNWDFVRRDTLTLFAKYAHRIRFGTLDAAILASARLAGATGFLSFDETLKAVALAEGLAVFPPLSRTGKEFLSQLK